MTEPQSQAEALRQRIAALRPWPEGERLIQALERLADTTLATPDDVAGSGGRLDVERLAEAMFRVGIGHRKGMTSFPWAVENQQAWAHWCGNGQVAAEYDRLAAPSIEGPRRETLREAAESMAADMRGDYEG